MWCLIQGDGGYVFPGIFNWWYAILPMEIYAISNITIRTFLKSRCTFLSKYILRWSFCLLFFSFEEVLLIYWFAFNKWYLRIKVRSHFLICCVLFNTLYTSCRLLRTQGHRRTFASLPTLLPASISYIPITLDLLFWLTSLWCPFTLYALYLSFSRFQPICYTILADVLVITSHLY